VPNDKELNKEAKNLVAAFRDIELATPKAKSDDLFNDRDNRSSGL
jgi:hypothetical protein